MFKKSLNEFNPFFNQIKNDYALLVTNDSNTCNGMTVSWGGIGFLWNKPVAFIFVRKSRYSLELLERGQCFSLNFYNGEYKNELLNIFGKLNGANTDKFKLANLTPVYGVDMNIYYTKESKQVLKMEKLYKIDLETGDFINPKIKEIAYKNGDYHIMYIGEIKEYLVDEE